MTARRFLYDFELLERCANVARVSVKGNFPSRTNDPIANEEKLLSSEPTNKLLGTNPAATAVIEIESCVQLFQLYNDHYGRQRDARTTRRLLQLIQRQNRIGEIAEQDERIKSFLRSVVWVHEYNRHHQTQEDHFHRVALNRFSDQLFLPTRPQNKTATTGFLKLRRRLQNHSGNMDSNYASSDESEWSDLKSARQLGWSVLLRKKKTVIITFLSMPAPTVEVAANLTIGNGSTNRLYNYKKEKKELKHKYVVHPTSLEIPTDAFVNGDKVYFATPELASNMDGALLHIKRNKLSAEGSLHKSKHKDKIPARSKSDKFESFLNWATNNNPDGVPLVHDPFDQGLCGSCWAFAAAGSLEANAARHEAHKAYESFTPTVSYVENPLNYDQDSNDTATLPQEHHEQAIAYAQTIEQQAFQMLDLSVQQLLDCDTAVDQGCTGGNPLLSFYYVHQHGITSWNKYPYVGSQNKCMTQLGRHPIATVKSWGLISSNHENHIELALRHIGPIAVGFNGAEPSFLSYEGGIFDAPFCKQTANHALLITGYGEEEVMKNNNRTKVVRFWYARNSWGTGWGENGYVRIRRHHGNKGTPGVCGIARSPTVALGGVLLSHSPETKSAFGGSNISDGNDSDDHTLEQMHNVNGIQKICLWSGLFLERQCVCIGTWVPDHQAILLGLCGVTLTMLVVWPLTIDYRRRSRRRHRRNREQLRVSERLSPNAINDAAEESMPLVGNDVTRVSYSAN